MSTARSHLNATPGYALDELRPLSVEQALSAGLATHKGNRLLASPKNLARIPDLARRLPSPHNDAVIGTLRKAMEAEGYRPDSTIHAHAAMSPDGPALVVVNGFRRLMARNVFQVGGPCLRQRSAFVLCWAPGSRLDEEGKVVDVAGGTGLAVRLAVTWNIPVLNLAIPEHLERVIQRLEQAGQD